MVRFGLYGSGWRSAFFLRVAAALPQMFQVAGLVTRDAEKATEMTQQFGVTCYPTVEALLQAQTMDFMVVSLNASVSVDASLALLRRDMPVLLETPVAPDMNSLYRFYEALPVGAKLQVAEQYPLQPMHQARLSIIKQGKLGAIGFVQMSNTHAFHAVALIRSYLGVGLDETAEITATSFPVAGVEGFMRHGVSPLEKVNQSTQQIAVLKFSSGKVGLLNHETGQHRSYVRSSIVQVKGERGEILNDQLKYLLTHETPITSHFDYKILGREDNFEGVGFKGIFVDNQWVYHNPYLNHRLSDDEIAVAQCLNNMAKYVLHNGPSQYGFAQAAQDTYLAHMVEQAIAQQAPLMTILQPWHE